MKLPNGYGSITKLSGKRRKPFMVRITGDKKYNDEKKDFYQERHVLGYYKTRKDAIEALSDYNKSPFNISQNEITFIEIYNQYKKKSYDTLSKSSVQSRETALKYCEPLHNIKVRDINVSMLESVIDACPHGSATKSNILTVMNTVMDYACKNNLVPKNPASFIKIGYSEPVVNRIPFTDEEINKLWELSNEWDIKIILILLYSGMRVNELLKNNVENVNIKEKWIYVPKELAKNNESCRYVPLHNRIIPLLEYFINNANKHNKEKLIVNDNGTVIAYNNFATRNLKRINKTLEVDHTMHDTRHTFASNGTKSGIQELYMQRIMGHKPKSILYNTYTHITIDDLLPEINKIK